MDKTYAAIEKLREVELELHRLKNYAEMMDKVVDAKRKWVGLTDEEQIKAWGPRSDGPSNGEIRSYARAIEAKLRERNT